MATPRTEASGRIVKRDETNNAGGELKSLLGALKGEIARALPKHLTGDRMARVIMTALSSTTDLALCSRESFAGSILQLSQLGLEPNTPLNLAYLIPRKNNKKQNVECTVIIGYQGYLELGRRAGVNCYAYVVREGDAFSYSLGLNPDLKHVPSDDPDRETKRITHAYAVARTREFKDDPIFIVLSRAQIEERRARSATPNSGPWDTDPEAMCVKSAIRALWKFLPKSAEMSTVQALEARVDTGDAQSGAYDHNVAELLQSSGVKVEGDDGSASAPALESGEGNGRLIVDMGQESAAASKAAQAVAT